MNTRFDHDPRYATSNRYRAGVKEITNEVERMFAEIRHIYKRVYVEGHLPPNLDATRKRRDEITNSIRQCVVFYKELNAIRDANGIGEETLAKLRKPLSKVYMEMIEENKLLKKFIQENEPEEDRVDWVVFLLSILDRAVISGFILTEKERLKVGDIKQARM